MAQPQALHSGKSVRDILTSVLTKKPTDPVFHFHPVQGRMPVEMSRLVMWAMHKDAARRFQSVKEMLDEIQDILNGDIQRRLPRTVVKSSFHGVSRLLDNYPIVVLLVIPCYSTRSTPFHLPGITSKAR